MRLSNPSSSALLIALLLPTLALSAPHGRVPIQPQVEPVEESDETPSGITEEFPSDVTDQSDTVPAESDYDPQPVTVEPTPSHPAVGVVPKDAPISISDTEPGDLPIDGFGLLDSGNEGFNEDIWQGSARPQLLSWIQAINGSIPSPALRDMLSRLLLTRAPLGNDAGSNSFLQARAQALFETGMDEKALELIDALPPASVPRELALLKTDILLYKGRREQMCEYVRESLTRFDDSQWMTRLIFCQAQEGKTDELALSLSLLKEQRGHVSPLMLKLMEHLSNPEVQVAPYPPNVPRAELGMLLAGGLTDIPPALLDKAPLPALALVVRNKQFDPETRAIAAEKLTHAGAEPVETLANAYKAFSFSKDELQISLKDLSKYYNVKGSALMYQAQGNVEDPAQRRALIRVGLRVMEKSGLRMVALKLYGDAARQVAASSHLNPSSRDFLDIACILLANGDTETVHNLLTRGDADKLLPESWLVMQMLQLAEGNATEAPAMAPEQFFSKGTDMRTQRTALRVEELMAALGTPVELGGQKPSGIATQSIQPSEDLRRAFDKARLAENKGETLLLSVLMLKGRLAETDDSAIADVIRAWMSFGLPAETRALALDALLAVQ